MNGNFTRLNRQNGGRRLKVEGWLVWDQGDTEATLTITVTQGAVAASSEPVTVTPPTDRWEATVNANGSQFVQGIAAGLAGATVQTSGGRADQSWNSGPIRVD